MIVTDAFKDGTQPTIPCPIHSPQIAPPTVDEFGIPVNLDTAQPATTEGAPTMTETTSTTQPDSTLTGGIFRTETQPPPTATGTSAPPTSTTTSPPP
jgi:hypothetical protein